MTNLFELIQKTALSTLEIELAAIKGLIPNINEAFIACVERLWKTEGRIVLTGIGKSAIVAQKIVATLNSTGTAALFMHAADAIHGDLGMVQYEDTVICLSNSGETPEIKILTPLLKRSSSLLVAMVGNPTSYLARQADYVLNTSVAQEACPNNLAPTASTTAQMVMGDVLAMCLSQMRGFSTQHFAQFHPGGTLGKRLYLRVDDIYPKHDTPQVNPMANMEELIVEISTKRLGATAVVDDQQHLLGIITDGDLRRALQQQQAFTQLTATDIMTLAPKTVQTGTLAVDALLRMQTYKVTQIIVMNEKQYVGMVHIHDLIKEGI